MYLVDDKHSNQDDIIIEGEFPIITDFGSPPNK